MTSAQWSPAQIDYAKTIVQVGRNTPGITAHDIDTALLVALTESSLQNYANSNVPESMGIKHDTVGNDSDSVGLFQQRPSQGWGTPSQLMDPATSAQKFYDALKKIPLQARNNMAPWILAQSVQKSRFNDGSNYKANYDQEQQLANDIGNLNPYQTAQQALSGNGFGWVTDPKFWQRFGIGALGALLIIIALWKWLSAQQFVQNAVSTVKKGAALAAVV